MSDAKQTPPDLEGVTSLYRRFRPGRFAQLRGQDHVVHALQGAVARDRVSHAYLFSGPRGTGKTTTARILAKALNCERPVDGDACDDCASCRAIAAGTSLDVVELDAASNNGVDDVRDIVAGAWHGTPGRWKVYIFDEVHQLSKAASAALLKTLEEPPRHVVFVLATTDPHKVLPTIRSRTQHLEFRLLNADTVATLLHDVERAAGLDADEATIDAAVRLGRGSARDALSALDQLIATGALGESRPAFDDLFSALVHSDAIGALRSLAVLAVEGWDPEQLAEEFAAELRQAFLLQVAPDVAHAVDADRSRLLAWGQQLGLAKTVRSLESVGRALREMKSAPDKMVTLEVTLVRLTKPELDHALDALEERVTRLERGAPARTPPAPEPAARRPIGAGVTTESPVTSEEPVSGVLAPPPAPATTVVNEAATSLPPRTTELSLDDVRQRFVERVVPRTSRAAQLLLRTSRVESLDGLVLTIAVANEESRLNTEMIAQGLRGALEHEFKTALTVRWTVDPTLSAGEPAVPRREPTTTPTVEDDEPDGDEPMIVVDSAAGHLIAEMFPGAEEIS